MDKQIEEMAKFTCRSQNSCYKGDCIGSGVCAVRENCEKLYNAGYRKIPENAVVLTREEAETIYGTLKANEKFIFDLQEAIMVCKKEIEEAQEVAVKEIEEYVQQARKEMAEKFAEEVDKWKRKAIHYYNLAKSTGVYCIVEDDEICKEISEGE